MTKLHRNTALVTGGSSGLGLAIATRFIAEGAFVYITGRRQAELERAVAALGSQAASIQADVSLPGDIERVVETIRRERGAIDILVANAGIVLPQTLEQATQANYDRTFDINVKGLYFTISKALGLLRSGSSVILVSSIAANKGVPGYGTYSASKAAIRSLSRTWTAELVERGIRINTLSPGPFDTPIMDSQADTPEGAEAVKRQWAAAVPMKRLGRPEELAAAALFLASDESSYVAGIDLIVDGGAAAV